MNSIEFTHLLSPLGLVAWQPHQRADGTPSLTRHETGSPDHAAAEAAVRSLVGGLPLHIGTSDLSGDAKPRRYSSDLDEGVLR